MGSGLSAKKVRENVQQESARKAKQMREKKYKLIINETFSMTEQPFDIATKIISDLQTSIPTRWQFVANKVESFITRSRAKLSNEEQIIHKNYYFESDDAIKIEFNYWIYHEKGKFLAPERRNALSTCYVLAVWYDMNMISQNGNPNQVQEEEGNNDVDDPLITLKTVEENSNVQSAKLHKEKYQALVNSCFNMTDFPREIAGQLMSNVEECIALNDVNRLWVSQQIVHAVCRSRTGLSPIQKISPMNSVTSVEGNGMDLSVATFSWVYEKRGKTLDAAPGDLLIRLLIAVKYQIKEHQKMDKNIQLLLQQKLQQ